MCTPAGLEVLGVEPVPLLASAERTPIWPKGVVGSITHTADYALAVLAGEDTVGLGVDAEWVGRVNADLYGRLFTASERDLLDALTPGSRDELATAIFGAKEAFYKAQHPTTRSWVGFQDVAARPTRSGWEFVPATDLAALGRWCWPVPFRWAARAGSPSPRVGSVRVVTLSDQLIAAVHSGTLATLVPSLASPVAVDQRLIDAASASLAAIGADGMAAFHTVSACGHAAGIAHKPLVEPQPLAQRIASICRCPKQTQRVRSRSPSGWVIGPGTGSPAAAGGRTSAATLSLPLVAG